MQVHAILDMSGVLVLDVTTSEYPYDSDPHYIDARLVSVSKKEPKEREIVLPKKEEIIQKMKKQVGAPYVW
jgi:hypothetical protein